MRLPVMAAVALAGRLLLAALFLHEAWTKLAAYSAALAYMQAFGVPGSCCRWRLRWNWAAAF
jgi:uncharacterized membrane protein YphA (DoxX/SURF4 family)